MCGVFGFAAKTDEPVNPKILERIATVTMRRGPHAWGMAWIDGEGRLRMYKQSGRIVDALGLLTMARDARLLIGHCRFATQGDPDNNLNNHPHPADGGWIVHNGVIHTYDNLVARYRLHPVSDCDSEVLGLLLEREKGDLFARAIRATAIAHDGPMVMLGIWKPDRLIAVRRGNPLHLGETSKGFYLASLETGLPGTVSALRDNEAIELGDG
jgi:glucosamine 6-phosphate synthetase-like amidotransferase/phosphosugar isomerase protein